MTIRDPNSPGSEKQWAFMAKLMAAKLDAVERDGVEKALAETDCTKAVLSKWIEDLLALPTPEPSGDLARVVEYLNGLEVDNRLTDFTRSLLGQWRDRGTLSEKQIACVLGRLDKATETIDKVYVPDGRYAVLVDDDWKLYRVWRGTRDPGVQHVYRVHGTEMGDRVYRREERDALVAIAEDPGQAAIRFGHHTGSCSKCGADLEVNLSRQMGIGPVCLKHWYPASSDRSPMLANARRELRDAGLDPSAHLDSLEVVA